MHAVTYTSTDGPAAIGFTELPDPTPKDGEVLVAVEAATINSADLAALSGAFGPRMPAQVDGAWIPGWDFAGHVTAVGSGVDESLVGAYVVGFAAWFATGNGGQAELIAAPAEWVARADESVPAEKLTTVGLNALTALQALDLAGLQPGSTILVTGAAGAVGGYGVELAAQRGLEVWGYASEADREAVLGFGATRFLAREDGTLAEQAPGSVDGVFDPAGIGDDAIAAVRDGGVYVSAGQTFDYPRGIRGERVGVEPNSAQLKGIADDVAAGRLSTRVAQTFPASEARAAYEAAGAKGLRGRIVLTF